MWAGPIVAELVGRNQKNIPPDNISPVSLQSVTMAVAGIRTLLTRRIISSSSLSSHKLTTSSVRLEYFFTKKHEYVKLEGNVG